MKNEEQLLDYNSYQTWKKDLPNHVMGFNEERKSKLPEYDIKTDNPYQFANEAWQFIFDDEAEIEKVVNAVNNILKTLN